MHYTILGIVWFATFAMTVQLGLWSNAILLAQIVLAGLAAFGFYQPLAVLMDEALGGEYTYFVDFLAIWSLFVAAMLILKVLDGLLSKKRVRFQERVDQFGGPLMGLVAGLLMGGIVLASLHAAPLPAETIVTTKADAASGSRLTAPDLLWLDLVEGAFGGEGSVLGSGVGSGFSTEDYVALYAARREAFAEVKTYAVKR